jgi:hypothetical protein
MSKTELLQNQINQVSPLSSPCNFAMNAYGKATLKSLQNTIIEEESSQYFSKTEADEQSCIHATSFDEVSEEQDAG